MSDRHGFAIYNPLLKHPIGMLLILVVVVVLFEVCCVSADPTAIVQAFCPILEFRYIGAVKALSVLAIVAASTVGFYAYHRYWRRHSRNFCYFDLRDEVTLTTPNGWKVLKIGEMCDVYRIGKGWWAKVVVCVVEHDPTIVVSRKNQHDVVSVRMLTSTADRVVDRIADRIHNRIPRSARDIETAPSVGDSDTMATSSSMSNLPLDVAVKSAHVSTLILYVGWMMNSVGLFTATTFSMANTPRLLGQSSEMWLEVYQFVDDAGLIACVMGAQLMLIAAFLIPHNSTFIDKLVYMDSENVYFACEGKQLKYARNVLDSVIIIRRRVYCVVGINLVLDSDVAREDRWRSLASRMSGDADFICDGVVPRRRLDEIVLQFKKARIPVEIR